MGSHGQPARRRTGQRRHEAHIPAAGSEPRDYGGRCEACGRRCFYTRDQARRFAATVVAGRRQRTVRCGRWWHLTGASAEAVAGLRKAAAGDD